MVNKYSNRLNVKRKARGKPKSRKNLKNERLRRGWTQEYVCSLINEKFEKKITGGHIGAIERGRRNPSIELIEILSILYQQPIEILLS